MFYTGTKCMRGAGTEARSAAAQGDARRDSLGLTVEDWILALLAYGSGRVWGKTRLQKALFILDRLEEKYGADFVPAEFKPHVYGPFSPDAAEALKRLEERGLIKITYREGAFEEPVALIEAANDEALRRGEAVLEKLKAYTAWDDIEARMSFALRAPLPELLWYVYDLWPEYTENSLIKGKVKIWKKRKLRKRLFPVRILR